MNASKIKKIVFFILMLGALFFVVEAIRNYTTHKPPPEPIGYQSKELSKYVAFFKNESPENIRRWLINAGPAKTYEFSKRLDGKFDQSGSVRQSVLESIYSLHHEGLPVKVQKAWAVLLRQLANDFFHKGILRSDFIAKSYIMEGDRKLAANEYEWMLKLSKDTQGYSFANNFYQENPDLRPSPEPRSPAAKQ